MPQNKPPHDDLEDFDFEDLDIDPASHGNSKSVKPQTKGKVNSLPDDDIDFDLEDHPLHVNKTQSSHHMDDLDLEDMPQPKSSHSNHDHVNHEGHEDNEEFSDIESEPNEYSEQEYQHDENETDESNESEDHVESDEENDGTSAKKKKGNIIIAVGVAAILGLAGFVGWNTFGPSKTVATPLPQQQQQASSSPRLPSNNTVPVNNNVVSNVNPSLPASGINSPTLPVIPTGVNPSINSAPTNAVNTAPVLPTLPSQTKETVLANAVVPSAGTSNLPTPALPTPSLPTTMTSPVPVALPAPVSSDSSSMSQLVQDFRSMNDQISAVSKRNDQIAADLARLPQIEGKIDQVGEKVNTMVNRTDNLEQRISALEQHKPNSQTPMSVSGGINPRVSEPRRLPEQSLRGYVLKGVSRSAAMVQSPNGQIEIVNIGQMLGNVGMAQSIQYDGQVWVLVTTAGIIRP